MDKAIVVTRPAARALSRMPRNIEILIREKLALLIQEPNALANNVKALNGLDGFHLRVGDWRVLFTIEADQIIVHDIGPRGSIYR